MKTINGTQMDLVGMKFNGIEVIEFVGTTKKGHRVYKVQSKTKGIYNDVAVNFLGNRRH
jgi:hypothetical protein